MYQFRVARAKPRKSSKPIPPLSSRLAAIADSLTCDENKAEMYCSECIRNGVTCYYDRRQSVKCAECVRHQRSCDGTFSLEEFRKVGEQKKLLQDRARETRQKVLQERRALIDAQSALVEAEAQDAEVQENIALLDRAASDMLRREMEAVGALNSLDNGQEVALADPDFVWSDVPVAGSPDWDLLLRGTGGSPGLLVG